MSTLWTPDGEHRVTPAISEEAAPAPPPTPSRPPGAPEPSEAELKELEKELVSAPVDAIVANHCFGLFQLAALHLAQRPPNLDAARLAIDALGALVEGLDGRLGDATGTLTDALAQIRLAYVELTRVAGQSAPEDAATSSADTPTA